MGWVKQNGPKDNSDEYFSPVGPSDVMTRLNRALNQTANGRNWRRLDGLESDDEDGSLNSDDDMPRFFYGKSLDSTEHRVAGQPNDVKEQDDGKSMSCL